MTQKPTLLAWEPSPEVERIRMEISKTLAEMGQLKQADVIAALFFLIMGSLMEASVEEQTNVGNSTLIQLAMDVFDGTGCRLITVEEDTGTKH